MSAAALLPGSGCSDRGRLSSADALANSQPQRLAVSSTYRTERLNLVLDTEGRIGSVNCG